MNPTPLLSIVSPPDVPTSERVHFDDPRRRSSGLGLHTLPGRLLPATPGVPAPARWEQTAFWTILLLSGLLQWHAVLHGGAQGQDFEYNYGTCIKVSRNFLQAWHLGRTNPPAFHLMAAALIRLVGINHGIVVIGLVNSLFSIAALAVIHLLARRLIRQLVFRLSLLGLIAFLPARLIHGVVVASDALTVLPFFLLALWLTRLTTETDAPRRRRLVWGICGLLSAGMCIKYTFLSSLAVTALVLAQMVRRGRLPVSEALSLATLAIGLPIVVFLAESLTQTNFQANFGMHGDGLVNNMSYASVLGLHQTDRHLLDAPRYDEPNRQPGEIPVFSSLDNDRDTRFELMIPNRYSYPGLLHWGVYTDALDIFQQHSRTHGYFGERTARNQSRMTVAVRTALPITLACVAAVAALTFFVGREALFNRAVPPRGDVEAALGLGLAWFGNIALLIPMVHGAYLGGYWTPRLVLPALLMFLVLTFHALDRWCPARAVRRVGGVVLGYVVLQAALQAAFLWN